MPSAVEVGTDWVPMIWFVALWVMVLSALMFFFQWSRQRRENPRPANESFETLSKSGSEKKSSEPSKKTGEVKPPPTVHKKVDAVLTEKTRDEMFEMISQVRSLTQEIQRPKPEELDLSDDEIKKLNESGVVRGLIETLMTEVQIEESNGHKFSKMTLDASLFFDESDVDFFEKEFGAQTQEESRK